MRHLDACTQRRVINPFVEVAVPSQTPTSPKHPLRSPSVSPARHRHSPDAPSVTVVGSEEASSRRTRPSSSDGSSADATEEDQPTNGVLCGTSDLIVHPVDPNDSLAGVALRYGVSIAALRRANRLWPSDPIYLRTELIIPRGDTRRARRPAHRASTTTLASHVDSPSSLSPDLLASSLVAARDIFISMLPARVSMESLSSKATASEDHELDDFSDARGRASNTETFLEEGYPLATLTAPHTRHARYRTPSSQPPTPADTHPNDDQALVVGDVRPPPSSSQGHVSRTQPFAVLPVRTSQLEPEPAMELPVRHPRM